MSNNSTLLRVSKLTKRYPGSRKKSSEVVLALDSVDLNLSDKGVTGLLGQNGAGKSSLLKIICGALTFDSGEVLFKGKSISEKLIESQLQIGYLPENNPLYEELYVREYLEFICNIRKISKTLIQKTLEDVGMGEYASQKIKTLSKGYHQRLGIAQAIIHSPDLLILDEPTNGLDPIQILEIRELIKDYGRLHKVILSTHIMQEVEATCDEVLFIKSGKILLQKPLEEIKNEYDSLEDVFSHW